MAEATIDERRLNFEQTEREKMSKLATDEATSTIQQADEVSKGSDYSGSEVIVKSCLERSVF